MLTATATYIHHTTTQKVFKAKVAGGQDRTAHQTEISLFDPGLGKAFVLRMLTDEPPLHLAPLKPMDAVRLELGVKRGDWEDEISLQNVIPAVPNTNGKAAPVAAPAGK